MASASNSTSPGKGMVGGSARRCTALTVASGRTTAARTLLVPTSMTRMLVGPPSGRYRSRRAGQECLRGGW